MIREIEEGNLGAELLPLKQQRCSRSQQEENGHGPESSGTRELVQPQTVCGIRHLIVILQIRHEGMPRHIQRRGSPTLLLPRVTLPLKQVAVFHRGKQLLRAAVVVGVVGLAFPRERDARAVMEIVVPQSVKPVSATSKRPYNLAVLRFVLS